MRLATVLSFIAAVAALPAAKNDVAGRASYSKVAGLKFNIEGVTKCRLINDVLRVHTNSLQTMPAQTATGSRSLPMTTM